MAENPLMKLPVAGQLGVAAGIAAVIVGAFYFLYWSPAVEAEQQKLKKLSELREDIRRLEAVANKLEEFRGKVAERERDLEMLRRSLPPEKETPDLMRKVEYLARQSNLNVRRFQPAATVSKDYYQEWPISIDVEGNYHNLALFFDRVGRLPRLVNVSNVRVRSQSRQSASNTIAASCTATTYVYVEKPPAPAGPAKPGGAK